MKQLENIITNNENFKTLSPEHVKELAGRASIIDLETGAFMFCQDGKADHFYVLTKGSVGLEIHAAGWGTVTMQTLRSGDLLGWSWMFPPYRWHFDAKTLEPSQAIAFDAATVRDKFKKDSDFGYQVMKIVATHMMDRIVAARLQILDLYGKNPDHQGYAIR